MAIPTCVFLDTNVLASQHYNFASTALRTFAATAAKHGIALLVPDPMEREVRRQMRERTVDAIDAVNKARRLAPFLEKWDKFPGALSQPSVEASLHSYEAWRDFLAQFAKVHRLGYDGVNMSAIMDSYDAARAPFGAGSKRKEFPDALIVAMLEIYAARQKQAVVVVSDDSDMKRACELRPSLLSFGTLPRLTELLVLGPDRVEELRGSVLSDLEPLSSDLEAAARELSFHHVSRRYYLHDSNLLSIAVTEARIVAVGDNECTLTFEAEMESEHLLEWQEDTWEDHVVTRDGWYTQVNTLSGTAKVTIDPTSHRIASVLYLEIDDGDVAVEETPRHY